MKTNRILFVLASIFIFVLYKGCQQEPPVTFPQDQAIRPDEEVAGLIQRVAMNDGSIDNIIDHASCISLELPYTVIVNGTELIINEEEDFNTVEHIIDKFEDDEDVIEIIYPVTVMQADYSELILNNEDDLEALADECSENMPDDDIECIDFIYPFILYIFNAQNQIPDVISVENDRDLYDAFNKFDDDELASFHYPIYLIDLSCNGWNRVYDKLELENYISAAEGACDEDDDNDHNDDDADVTYFRSVLMAGKWVIDDYTNFVEIKTSIFSGYTFEFFEHGLVEASTKNESFPGSWYANGDNGVPKLEIDFRGESPLDQLEDDWKVETDFLDESYLINASHISLLSNDEIWHLSLERPNVNLLWHLEYTMEEGTWVVTGYTNSGNDESGNYDGLLFNFKADGTVIVSKDEVVIGGTWSYPFDPWTGIGPFNLDFVESDLLNAFNNNWEVVNVAYNRLELFHFNEEDGTSEGLTFERIDY